MIKKLQQTHKIIALNHESIWKHPERIVKIEPCIDKYNWKDINFPTESKNWEKKLNKMQHNCTCFVHTTQYEKNKTRIHFE